MNVAGIIAEYNPFHNGHKYQIEELKRRTGADYVIVAMSGDFVQRGTPALLDKYTRTWMALSEGADLVFELPTIWATASAEYFASAGVHLLGETCVVNTIGFGVEKENAPMLSSLARLMLENPKALGDEILFYQRQGMNYPTARMIAVCALLPQYSKDDVRTFLSMPNNILALEYEKALSLWNTSTSIPIKSCPIQRMGDDYHSVKPSSEFASATAIRTMIQTNPNWSKEIDTIMPPEASLLFRERILNNEYLLTDSVSEILYYKLLSSKEAGYEQYADCTTDLSNKILNHLNEYRNFGQFCSLLKSKDLTYTRISRVLLHILLDITKADYATGREHFYVSYLRVLGFREEAAPLLSAIKKEASVPLITKVSDASGLLMPDSYPLLQKDIYAADLYRGLMSVKNNRQYDNEYTQGLIIT